MAIQATLRKRLKPGMRLVAKYKAADYSAELVEADGHLRYRLADGREFDSPSAAGSAVMGGIACNGWRFWSVAEPAQPATPKPRKAQTQ